jgi:class 3 adenylate cyclase
METSQDHALLLEALSDKVLHQLPQAVWTNLFLGAERDSIRFEQRNLTLVHADADLPAGRPGSATERFYQELQRLNTRHGGRLDPYVDATALVTFEDPGSAVRMAMELQAAAGDVSLRIGVVSGPCTLAFFRAQGRLWCTPLGAQPARAAEVAATAKPGGIVISPEAYDPAERRARLRADTQGAVDFRDSEVDLSTLAGGAPLRSVDILLA